MKALVGAFNQEKALVGAFSVIVQLHRLTDLRHYLQLFPCWDEILVGAEAGVVTSLTAAGETRQQFKKVRTEKGKR